MKLLFEVLVAIILHPVAFVLTLINLAGRDDLAPPKKVLWGVIAIVWGIGPILYLLLADGQLW